MIETILNYMVAIISPLGAGYKFYEWRHLRWNKMQRERYMKTGERIYVDEEIQYNHKIKEVLPENVKLVKAMSYRDRGVFLSLLGFKRKKRKYPEGRTLPAWLKYDPITNALKSKPGTPTLDDIGCYTIQVIDHYGKINETFDIKDYYKSLNVDFTEYTIKRIPDIDKPPYHIFNRWQSNTGFIGISEKLLTFIENQDKDNKSYLSNPDNRLNIESLKELLEIKGAGTIALENKIREEILELDERKDWVDKNSHPLMLSDKLNSERINFEIKSAIKSFEGMSVEEAYLCWKVWEKWVIAEKIVEMHKSIFEYMATNKISQLGELSSDGIIFEDGIVKGKEGRIENIIASGQASAYCA